LPERKPVAGTNLDGVFHETAAHSAFPSLRVCSAGLVGWFMCDQWDAQDYRRDLTPKMTVGEAQAHFDKQAADLSGSSRQIRAFILNAAL
jgi:hypothetical protein